MKKGISFYYGFSSDPNHRAKLIKDAGFECVLTNQDKKFNKQNGSIKKQSKLLKKYGIAPSSLHFVYKDEELPFFWEKGEIGDRMERSLKRDVRAAHKYGFSCVDVHVDGEPNEIGLNRIKRVLPLCEKLNIPLAFENINHNEAFEYVLDNLKSNYVKFCFDCGHNNLFSKDKNYLEKYGDRLAAVHLNDNMGGKSNNIKPTGAAIKTYDIHALNRFGNIDWDKLALALSKCPEVNLDYELLMKFEHNLTEEEVLAECFKQAQTLEQKITYYKTHKENLKSTKQK